MRKYSDTELKDLRITTGQLASSPEFGMCGAFRIPLDQFTNAICVAQDATLDEEWEHVSIYIEYFDMSHKKRTRAPTWDECHQVKRVFWGDGEWVAMFHVPLHLQGKNKEVLHLYKPVKKGLVVPSFILEGVN